MKKNLWVGMIAAGLCWACDDGGTTGGDASVVHDDAGASHGGDAGTSGGSDGGGGTDAGSGGTDAGSGGTDAGSGGTDAGGGDTDAGGPTGPAGPGEYRTDYQTSSDFFTRMSHPADSGSVHGTVRIWYSSNVMDFPLSGPFEAPVGTVAIKEEYGGSGNVIIKVVMIKREAGYDPANNDWYYEARNTDDTVASDPTPGTPSLCIGCHQASPDTDYLRGFGISN